MKPKMAVRICVIMAALITLLGSISAYLQFEVQNNWPFVTLGVGSGVITFFGLLILCQTSEERWKVTEDAMRTAIAGTIVVVYLVLVAHHSDNDHEFHNDCRYCDCILFRSVRICTSSEGEGEEP
jgi:hypothetical protein